MIYNGIKVTILGKSIEPTQREKIIFFPGNLNLANAYPQIVAVDVPASTEGIIIVIVFRKYNQNGKFSSAIG